MIVGAINNKSIKATRYITVYKAFGLAAAIRTWEAKHSKRQFTFLDVVFKNKGLTLNNNQRGQL